ncbi:hypothetical protein Poli38472_009034 [Pythium oligandrum]|uniref:Ysc84 actin-binding domain-containing protein n=1 Tax=Pythium oligandrum TaxID=41045 RepID=A0A8K1CJZ7_PYTOL|nr:hypothetical protein Poli38472_009034 [Pythium oligandrum]|eukprot:TMW64867.1 hypothetical protein Poli38472_009034 [Pythium oligandrum]
MPINAPYHSSMEKEIRKAANIINAFFDSRVRADSSIPAELIQNCAGLAFLTVVKAGMIWTGKLGTGVVISRLEDGSWSPPSGIGTAGVGFGAEIGGEIVDFMIILGSPSAVKTFKKGTQVSVGAGLDLAVGPVGRAAGASVNAGGGGLSGNYTYSHAKGAFAGVGLHGSTILVRGDMNSKFYGRDVTPMEILNGHVQAPPGTCDVLYDAIERAATRGGSMYSRDSSSYGISASEMRRNSSLSQSGVSSRGSFDQSSYNSASSSSRSSTSNLPPPTTAQPMENDPRLRRLSSYKSERELYEEFSKNKSSSSISTGSSSSSSYSSGYGAPAAAAASAGYAAQPANGGYGAGYGAPAAQPTNTGYGAGYGAPAAQPVNTGYGTAGGYSAAPAPGYPAPGATPYATPAAPPAPVPPRVVYKPAPPPAQTYTTPAAPRVPPPPIPSPATGAETKAVYTEVMNFITARCPHANLQVFKDNCRLFGQDQMSVDAFFAYLTSVCTSALIKELMPKLVRLLPTQEKRERLWAIYVRDVLLIR